MTILILIRDTLLFSIIYGQIMIKAISTTGYVFAIMCFLNGLAYSKDDPWFVQLQGGADLASHQDSLSINNHSNFPAPQNVDVYSLKSAHNGTVALTLGKQFSDALPWISHYTISGRIQYIAPSSVGNTITLYSMPAFLNYNYNWNLSSLAVTADTKLSLLNSAKYAPYVNLGFGVSFNDTESYSETALAGVTPRVSPGFANHTTTQFTYHLGAGLDFNYNASWRLSGGYEFESLGNFASGQGQTTWSADALHLNNHYTHMVLFGITYFIN